jgi:5'-3' exonuclease
MVIDRSIYLLLTLLITLLTKRYFISTIVSFDMKTKTCKQFTKRRKRKGKRKRKEMFKWTKSVLKISIGLMKIQFSLQMHGDLFIAFYHITGWKASTYD